MKDFRALMPMRAKKSKGTLGAIGALAIVLLLAGPSAASGADANALVGHSQSCQPTDQDKYVYKPQRLSVVKACIDVTGTVDVIRYEADGDRHILVRLDRRYRYLLTPANQGEERGDLVVEPVCVGNVSQGDAKVVCKRDHDPLTQLPKVGTHVWLEGRLVHDLEHGGWTELHPLYRWGPS